MMRPPLDLDSYRRAIRAMPREEFDAHWAEHMRHARWRMLHLAIQAKYSPEQPRDELGRWAPWDHAGEGQGGTESFGEAPDGTRIDEIGGIPDSEKTSTVQSFMSKYCNAGIRAEMPGQFLQMPIADVIALAQSGNAAARTCLKLLSRSRFQK